MGQHSDTADMRPPITRQPSKATQSWLCACKPKTLKMSAYGFFFPYCATPKGLANTVGAAHTRVRHVAGVQGKNLLHPYHKALGRLQPVKAKPLRGCFASLDGFPAPSASVSFATPTEMERGQGRRSRAFYP